MARSRSSCARRCGFRPATGRFRAAKALRVIARCEFRSVSGTSRAGAATREQPQLRSASRAAAAVACGRCYARRRPLSPARVTAMRARPSTTATDRATSAASSGSTRPGTTSPASPTSRSTRSSTAGRSPPGSRRRQRRPHHDPARRSASSTRCSTSRSCARSPASSAIGHVRYSTTGSSAWENAQPVIASDRRELALAHNGNLINAVELHAELREAGRRRSARPRTPRSSPRCSPPTTAEQHRGRDRRRHAAPAGRLLDGRHDPRQRRRLPRPGRPAAAVRSAGSATATASPASRARSTSSAPSCCARSSPARWSSLARGRHRARARSSRAERRAFCVFEHIYFARPDSILDGNRPAGLARPMGEHPRREAPASRPTS